MNLDKFKELVQEAASDRMDSDTPDNSWCAAFQEYVPLLITEIENLTPLVELARETADEWPTSVEFGDWPKARNVVRKIRNILNIIDAR